LVLFASAVWLTPAPARADDDDTVVARERFKEGVTFFDQKQYDKARVAFLQAYALKKHPAVLLNLAHSELLSGREADAAKHFSMYLREVKNPTDAEKQGAESGLLAAKAVVGEVAVEVEVEGADVYVDGRLEGRSPLLGPVFVEPGTHTIEARKDGRSTSTEISASAGQATSTTLRFETRPAPGAAAESGAGPTHDEDSDEPETAPATGGRKPFFKWVGETPVAWVGTGLTALGIVGGIGFALGARTSYDSADSVASQIEDRAILDATPQNNPNGGPTQSSDGLCVDPNRWLSSAQGSFPTSRAAEYQDACQKLADNQESGDQLKMLSIVSWVVAGAAAAGTVVYYFVDSGGAHERGSKDGVRVGLHPVITPTERGLGVVGRF
jgi:hypothetical protein